MNAFRDFNARFSKQPYPKQATKPQNLTTISKKESNFSTDKADKLDFKVLKREETVSEFKAYDVELL